MSRAFGITVRVIARGLGTPCECSPPTMPRGCHHTRSSSQPTSALDDGLPRCSGLSGAPRLHGQALRTPNPSGEYHLLHRSAMCQEQLSSASQNPPVEERVELAIVIRRTETCKTQPVSNHSAFFYAIE